MTDQNSKPATTNHVWNSEDLRPFWADGYGTLRKVAECGCRTYDLGRGLCAKHFEEIFTDPETQGKP